MAAAGAAESAKQASAMNARDRPLRGRIEEVLAGDSRPGMLAVIRAFSGKVDTDLGFTRDRQSILPKSAIADLGGFP